MELSRILQVPLREIWKHEASNFTKWLALDENLALLSEEINIELSVIETEYNIGRFHVDIYAQEANTNRKVIIENQLEKTDHDHLGKLITYASGVDAEIIIWIVKEGLEEHQQALEWLNENTGEKLNFFLIRMEVWKIGDSNPAPNFHILTQPNNWFKTVKSSLNTTEVTETKNKQLRFWDGFKTYCDNNKIKINLRKTSPQHWYDISFGRSDCHIALTINSQKKELGCEIYIPNAKETYIEFKKHEAAINTELANLEWMELPTKKASRIKLSTKGDFSKENDWENHFQWLSDQALKFQEVFRKY
jgi:Domain of unknown function (DUF4268)